MLIDHSDGYFTHFSPNQLRKTVITIKPLTWQQFVDRQRETRVNVPYGEKLEEMDEQILFYATPRGLRMMWYGS